MFDSLTQRLSRTLDALRGQGRLTEDQIRNAARDLRMALLEADVALPVVKEFVDKIRNRALGGEAVPLNLRTEPPAVVLMCGLQGSGKTTTTGKLALRLRELEKKSV